MVYTIYCHRKATTPIYVTSWLLFQTLGSYGSDYMLAEGDFVQVDLPDDADDVASHDITVSIGDRNKANILFVNPER